MASRSDACILLFGSTIGSANLLAQDIAQTQLQTHSSPGKRRGSVMFRDALGAGSLSIGTYRPLTGERDGIAAVEKAGESYGKNWNVPLRQ
jgi:hypothetical protein